MPAYANAVGATADGVTYFIGSIFFTSASFSQLVQAQTPAMTNVDVDSQHTRAPLRFWAWLPHDRNWLAAITQLPGTLFFNISTLAALIKNLSVHQQDRRIWRPDFYGSTLFLIASVFGILAAGRFLSFQPRSFPWLIAWLNMIGSILFMFSALASYVLPTTGEFINSQASRRRHAPWSGLLLPRCDLDVARLAACRSHNRARARRRPAAECRI